MNLQRLFELLFQGLNLVVTSCLLLRKHLKFLPGDICAAHATYFFFSEVLLQLLLHALRLCQLKLSRHQQLCFAAVLLLQF